MTVIGLMHRLPNGSWIDPSIVRVAYVSGTCLIFDEGINVSGYTLECDTREAAQAALAALIRACDTARMAAMTPEQRLYYSERSIEADE